MHLRTRIAAAAAALALGGCTLADVVIEPSEDRLVVEAVLRTDARMQYLLLHRSVRDGVAPGEPGAEVVVTRGDGLRVVFQESADPGCYVINPRYLQAENPVEIRGTCYQSPLAAGRWVRAGDTYDLSVRTVRGETARARTVVPGAFSLVGMPFSSRDDVLPQRCTVPPGTPVPLVWTQAAGAWGYIAPLHLLGLQAALPDSFNAPDPLELVGVSVSARDTTLLLPAQFGIFQRLDYDQDLLRLLQGGLPAGVRGRVLVAAADRNYINGVRGGTFNPSGQVRISSIVGDGVGVFGSLVPLVAAFDTGAPGPGRPTCPAAR